MNTINTLTSTTVVPPTKLDQTKERCNTLCRFASIALLGALSFLSSKASAQDTTNVAMNGNEIEFVNQENGVNQDDVVEWDEVVNQQNAPVQEKSLDQEKLVDQEKSVDQEEVIVNEKPIDFHGMIRGGSEVVPLGGALLSDDPCLLVNFSFDHKGTGVGGGFARVDNFKNDPDHPYSRATVLDAHWSKNYGKLRTSVTGQYTAFDNAKDGNTFSPVMELSYGDKGWKITADYWHDFKKGPDNDSFRFALTKKLNNLTFNFHARWKKQNKNHISERLIVDYKLSDHVGFQFSALCSGKKLNFTEGVYYTF